MLSARVSVRLRRPWSGAATRGLTAIASALHAPSDHITCIRQRIPHVNRQPPAQPCLFLPILQRDDEAAIVIISSVYLGRVPISAPQNAERTQGGRKS